jgi:chromosome segregation ATPase
MLSDIRDQIQDLKADNQRLTEDVSNLKADNQRLTEDVSNLKADNQRLTEDNKKLKADNRKLSTDVLVHGQDIDNLKAANKKLKEDHGKEISKLERQYTHLHNETFKKLNEDRKLLESQNERLTERVDTLQNQNKEMKKHLGYHTRVT